MSKADVRSQLMSAIKDAGGIRSLSRAWGISPAMLSDVANGRRMIGPKVLAAMKLRRVVTYNYIPISDVPFA